MSAGMLSVASKKPDVKYKVGNIAEMPYEPIHGPVLILMAIHYVWYGILLLCAIWLEWAKGYQYHLVLMCNV